MAGGRETYLEEEAKRLEINLAHMDGGVKFVDPKAAYIDEDVKIGKGTMIYPGTVLEGKVIIGENCIIGPGSHIVNSTIGSDTKVENSVVLDSSIGNSTNVGPFAYLRPHSNIGDHCKVGDFVEVKNSSMGNGAKASHLSYIGDSDVGENVNIGCGVIFVNYDGTNKHRSVVGEGSFIGCNSNIVSPVTIEEGAYIAAGSTVTQNVPKGSLYVARAKGKIILDWVERRGLLKKRK